MAVQDVDLDRGGGGVTVADAPPSDLTPKGRRVRLGFLLAGIVFLLYGTIFGQDVDFPFGPFKMYAGYYPPNGVITSTGVNGIHANGVESYVSEADTGIPRGDIEGELGDYEANPNRLGDLAAAFHRKFPNASPFVSMQIVQKQWHLHDRKVVAITVVTLVKWHAK